MNRLHTEMMDADKPRLPSSRRRNLPRVIVAILVAALILGYWVSAQTARAYQMEALAREHAHRARAQAQANAAKHVLDPDMYKQVTNNSDKSSTIRDLRKEVIAAFDLRQKLQRDEIARLRLRLRQLEARVTEREKLKRQIIDLRVRELENKPKSGSKKNLNMGDNKLRGEDSSYRQPQDVDANSTESSNTGTGLRPSATPTISSGASLDQWLLYKPDVLQDSIASAAKELAQSPTSAKARKKYDLAVAQYKNQLQLIDTAAEDAANDLAVKKNQALRLRKLADNKAVTTAEAQLGSAKAQAATAQLKKIKLIQELYVNAGLHAKLPVDEVRTLDLLNKPVDYQVESTQLKGVARSLVHCAGGRLVVDPGVKQPGIDRSIFLNVKEVKLEQVLLQLFTGNGVKLVLDGDQFKIVNDNRWKGLRARSPFVTRIRKVDEKGEFVEIGIGAQDGIKIRGRYQIGTKDKIIVSGAVYSLTGNSAKIRVEAEFDRPVEKSLKPSDEVRVWPLKVSEVEGGAL